MARAPLGLHRRTYSGEIQLKQSKVHWMRWLVLAAITLTLLLAVLFIGHRYATSNPGVSLANFQRLDDGMTLKEISHILGRPPDEFELANGQWVAFWDGEEGGVSINSRHGHLTGYFSPTERENGLCDSPVFLRAAPISVVVRLWNWLQSVIPIKCALN